MDTEMKSILIFLLLTISVTASGQITIDTTSKIVFDSIYGPSDDLSPYLGLNMSENQSSKIIFDSISKNDYANYKKSYHSKIILDSSNIVFTDSTFTIKTENKKITFQTWSERYPPNYSYYLGFLKPLNLFLVQDINGNDEVGSLLLIDNRTGKIFYFYSEGDEPYEKPLISPKNNYLLSSVYISYENECFIKILKVKRNKHNYQLENFALEKIWYWYIEEIVWINENSFALSVKEKNNSDENNELSGISCYFRARFAKE